MNAKAREPPNCDAGLLELCICVACSRLIPGRIKTSKPYIVIGTPLWKTIAAASGSCQTLNSAAAVALPAEAEPPIKTIRCTFLAVSGKARKNKAMLVNGAKGTIVTGSFDCSIKSRRSSTAERESTFREDGAIPKSPMPSAPCTYSAY